MSTLKVTDLAQARAQFLQKGQGGSGSGEPPDDTQDRLAKLEAAHEFIHAALDAIAEKLDGIQADGKRRSDVSDSFQFEVKERLSIISVKLDAKANSDAVEKSAGDVRTGLEAMKGDIAQKALATDLAKLSGAVDKLPGNLSFFLGLAGFAVTIFVAAGVAKHFGW